ncbi:MAG: DUF418 domain-containing protein [bacterium]
MTGNNKPAPTAPDERYISLDILRGFAVLGILIMNIQSYSMPEAAYLNPTAFGDLTVINKWIWIVSHVLADQKFISLFSIMFGAGIILFTSRIEARGLKPAGLHYRRIFWLLLIGLIHAYGFWHGDILVTYALCAMIAYPFRKLKPQTLLIVGLIIFSVSSLLFMLFGFSISEWPQEAVAGTLQSWKPDPVRIAGEIAAYRGGWLQQMTHRVFASLNFQIFIFLIWTGWRVGGLMLLGMALYKWDMLTAKRSQKFYGTLMGVGFGIGLLLIIMGVIKNFAAGWSLEYSMFLGSQFNYWGSLLVALGYIGLIMLLSKYLIHKGHKTPLQAVGRSAFTNYLFQTVICTFIFYGHGLGLFGKVERITQLLMVVGVWTLQLIISPVWLRYFRYGPVEWIWRSLTYWKIQPLMNRKRKA